MNEKFCILIKISLKFVPNKGLIDNNPSIGLDNGLAPNRRQAIIWTNADSIPWCIYAALGEMSFSRIKWHFIESMIWMSSAITQHTVA